MKIALAQIDPTVGDFTGNLEKIVVASRHAADQGARLTVFSELAICGYPPADFLEKPSFLARCRSAVDELADGHARPAHGRPGRRGAALRPRRRQAGLQCRRSRSTAAACCSSSTSACCPSTTSSTSSATSPPSGPQKVIDFDGVRLAVTICEDAWNDKNFWPRRLYTVDPMEELMRQHPALHINLSSSPFWHGKRAIRRQMLAAIARRDAIPVLMCNQVGGNDSLIFDGSSLALNARGELIAQAASFAEDLVVVDPFNAPPLPCPKRTTPKPPIARSCWAPAIMCASAASARSSWLERRHRLGSGGRHRH